MDETLANLMIVLKTVGLDESKVGLRDLSNILKATGMSADGFAASVNKSFNAVARESAEVHKNSAAKRMAVVEQQKLNAAKLEATSLARQLETAEESHNRRLRNYSELLRRGVIDQELFNRAQAASLNQMRSQQSLGTKGGGLASMQLGYGIQDFATVAAMGGENAIGRAFMSASNNLGQLVVVSGVLNPAMAALAATGVTLAAVFGPQLWDAITGGAGSSADAIRDMTAAARELIESLPDSADRLGDSLSFRRRLGGATSNAASDMLLDNQDATQVAQMRAGLIGQRLAVPASVASAESVARAEEAARVARTVAEQRMMAAGATTGQIRQVSDSSARAAYDAEIAKDEKVRDLKQEQIENSMRLRDLEQQRAQIMESMPEKQRREIAQQRQEIAFNQIQVGLEASRNVGSMLRDSRRAADVAAGRATSGQFSLTDSLGKFAGELANDPNETPESRAAMLRLFGGAQQETIDADIKRLREQQSFRPSMGGISEFGKQFQMALLAPDDAKKQREQQIKLLEQSKVVLENKLQELIDKTGKAVVN